MVIMTGKSDAILRHLKTIEARVGSIGIRMNSIDFRIGSIEFLMNNDEPSSSAIEVETKTLGPQMKKLKSSQQSDVDSSAESITSSATIRSVETPMESENLGESNPAMSHNGNKDNAKPLNSGISPSLPIQCNGLLSSGDSEGRDPSDSIDFLGYIHPAVQKRNRSDFEEETLSVSNLHLLRMLSNTSDFKIFGSRPASPASC